MPNDSGDDLGEMLAARSRYQAARNALVEQFMPLVKGEVSRAMRRLPRRFNRDECESEVVAAVLAAIERFDAAKGSSFVAFLRPVIRGAILDWARPRRLSPKLLSLDDLIRAQPDDNYG